MILSTINSASRFSGERWALTLNSENFSESPDLETRSVFPYGKGLLNFAACHELDDEDDERDDQDEVNETAGDIEPETERPEDEKNYED